jgi:cytokinin dehydrogenase
MNVTVEAQDADALDDDRLLADLKFHRLVYAENLGMPDFTLLGRAEERPLTAKVAHVFTDVLVPWSSLERFIKATQAHIFPSIVHVEHMVLWPMTRAPMTRPMLRIPAEEMFTGFGLYSRVPQAYGPSTLAATQGFVDLAMMMGGTYYLTGSVRLDAPRLARQFGETWPAVREAKRTYDPQGLLNPGLFLWEEP